MDPRLPDKFSRPSSLTGDWTAQRALNFWGAGEPYAIKFAVEKMTGTLLDRDAADAQRLAYAGSSPGAGEGRDIRLRFEAVIGLRRLYSLEVSTRAQRRWSTEASFLAAVERTFSFWSGQLDLVRDFDIDWSQSNEARYERSRADALAAERAEAERVEDPAPIAALQRAVVDALRAGSGFFTAHKEGGTQIYFDGHAFVRADYGDDPSRQTYADERALLDALRRFFDWDSRRDCYPHPAPELAVWQHIHGRLTRRRT